MQESYLDYAMSVIVSRALPDVRDGLKPVHRRILVCHARTGLAPQCQIPQIRGRGRRRFGKIPSARRHCGVRLHGAYGAGFFHALPADRRARKLWIDGRRSAPAAMRYTEARMSALAEELLVDLEKETVDLRDNYDATRKEPVVLPGKLPNLAA